MTYAMFASDLFALERKQLREQARDLRKALDGAYRFVFVGRTDVVPRYFESLRALIERYRMPPDRFLFTGPVPDIELAGPVQRLRSNFINGIKHMPVRFTPARTAGDS